MPQADPVTIAPEARGLVDAWVTSLAQVLEQYRGQPSPCTALSQPPPELPPRAAGDLWLLSACSGGFRGEMSLRIPPSATLRLAAILMQADSSTTTEVSSEHREAVLELMRQVVGHVATTLHPRWSEVQLGLEVAATMPSWPASATVWLCASRDSASDALVEMHFSAALLATLRAEKTGATQPAATPVPAPSAAADPKINLSLLMDVGLGVTLRFGGRRLLLREVLELNPGAVLELDRQVEEPVDMLLDGRLVARGEIVVLDGNYALRITEVAPPHMP